MERLYRWLIANWVASALSMGIMFFLLIPVLATVWPLALLLIYAQQPVYMVHQVEEHTGDRFRLFVNRDIFGGVEALTSVSVVWINLPGVWGLNLLSLYAAVFFGLGWGLSAIYLTLVNGISHVGAAIGLRRYNPGLWTSLALFIPCSFLALFVFARQSGVTLIHHAVGLSVSFAVHIGIIVSARINVSKIHSKLGVHP